MPLFRLFINMRQIDDVRYYIPWQSKNSSSSLLDSELHEIGQAVTGVLTGVLVTASLTDTGAAGTGSATDFSSDCSFFWSCNIFHTEQL